MHSGHRRYGNGTRTSTAVNPYYTVTARSPIPIPGVPCTEYRDFTYGITSQTYKGQSTYAQCEYTRKGPERAQAQGNLKISNVLTPRDVCA